MQLPEVSGMQDEGRQSEAKTSMNGSTVPSIGIVAHGGDGAA